MSTPGSPAAKPRRRWPWIVGAVVLVIAVALAGFWFWSSSPTAPAAFEYEPVDENIAVHNAAVASMLALDGIEESYVEVTPQRIHVVYELPPEPEARAGGAESGTARMPWSEVMQEAAFGTAAAMAGNATNVAVTQSVDGEPVLLWVTPVANWKAFVLGQIDRETYEKGILKLPL